MATSTPKIEAIDRHVGMRLRERRIMLGLTQLDLAGQLGITYQQLHKYEQAINRISATRLYDCARVLRTPIGFFYEQFGDTGPSTPGVRQRMALELSRAFNEIVDPRHQTIVAEVARALAAAEAGSPGP